MFSYEPTPHPSLRAEDDAINQLPTTLLPPKSTRNEGQLKKIAWLITAIWWLDFFFCFPTFRKPHFIRMTTDCAPPFHHSDPWRWSSFSEQPEKQLPQLPPHRTYSSDSKLAETTLTTTTMSTAHLTVQSLIFQSTKWRYLSGKGNFMCNLPKLIYYDDGAAFAEPNNPMLPSLAEKKPTGAML